MQRSATATALQDKRPQAPHTTPGHSAASRNMARYSSLAGVCVGGVGWGGYSSLAGVSL